MRMNFTITYEDGHKVTSVAKAKDFVAFERQYGQSMSSFDPSSGVQAPIEWMFYLAWSPLHRSKQEPRAFDEFLDDVDDIECEVGGEEAGPFPSEAPAEPSPT